jgi:hypothetical protein
MMEDGEDDLDQRLGIENPKNNNGNGANFNRALQKAAGHMENTFVAAFTGVVLGVILLRDSATYASQIRALMPQQKFDTMAFILKKFFIFMQMSVWKIFVFMFFIKIRFLFVIACVYTIWRENSRRNYIYGLLIMWIICR